MVNLQQYKQCVWHNIKTILYMYKGCSCNWSPSSWICSTVYCACNSLERLDLGHVGALIHWALHGWQPLSWVVNWHWVMKCQLLKCLWVPVGLLVNLLTVDGTVVMTLTGFRRSVGMGPCEQFTCMCPLLSCRGDVARLRQTLRGCAQHWSVWFNSGFRWQTCSSDLELARCETVILVLWLGFLTHIWRALVVLFTIVSRV